MSSNSSLTNNASLSPAKVNVFLEIYICFTSTAGTIIITSFTITCILLLVPLFILVLCFGYQRSRNQGCDSQMSHTDFLTHHMVVIQLFSVFGVTIICCGIYANLPLMMMFGFLLYTFNQTAQLLIHILTCLELYMAVVHPITYRNLRTAKWTRIKNSSISGVYLLSLAVSYIYNKGDPVTQSIVSFSEIVFFLLITSFCSLSVLRFLTRPGPGDKEGNRRADQSKMRAFYTIMAILGALFIRFVGHMTAIFEHKSIRMGENTACFMWLSTAWCTLPSNLVLPLLFLHRTGKWPCCKNSTESGQAMDC